MREFVVQLRAVTVPRWAPGGYAWESAEDVLDVPEPLASSLLVLPHFRLVLDADLPEAAPSVAPEAPGVPVEPLEVDGATELHEALAEASATRRRGRPRKED